MRTPIRTPHAGARPSPRPRVLLLGPLVAAVTWAALLAVSSPAQAQKRGGGGLLRQGSVGTRLGAGAFAVRSVTTDGQGNVIDEDTSLGLSLLGGVGYALHSRLALDFDLETFFGFEPDLELLQVEMVPGARLFITPRLYGRAAYAVRLKDPTNQLLLLGAGTYLSLGNPGIFIELSFVAHSKNPVNSRFVPRIGLELAF